MALSKEIREALKDVKIGDESALSLVETWKDKAEAKDKVQKANDDLTTQRKEWEAEKKEYKSKLSEFEKSDKEKSEKLKIQSEKISTLEKEKLTPEEREKLKMSESIKADLNKVVEELESIKADHEKEKQMRIEAEKKSKEATFNEKKQAQKTAIANELNKHKITDAKNTQAIHTLFGEGNAELIVNDDGTIEEKYYTKNKDGERVTSTLTELVEKFAENNKHLVASSGNAGTGQQHYRADSSKKYANYQELVAEMEADWDK